MKKLVLFAAFATLAACSKPEAAPAVNASEPASAAAAATASATASADAATAANAQPAAPILAADGKPSVGKFKITAADGKVYMEEAKPDGTYVETLDGKVTESGKWVQKSPETYCTTKDEAGAKERCGTEKVDAKGVWTSVNSDGKTVTIVRVSG